jgi:hypothetical protein
MTQSGPDPKGGVAPISERVMNLPHFVRQAARRYGQEIGLVWGTRPGPGPRSTGGGRHGGRAYR